MSSPRQPRPWPHRLWGVAAAALALLVLLRGLLPPGDLAALSGGAVCVLLALAGGTHAWRFRGAGEGARFGRDPALGVLLVALAALLALFFSHGFRLTSDGVDHFVYLRSVWMDGDLDLANDYARVSPRGRSVDAPTPLGRTGNLHPVGPALLWAPLYLAADGLTRLTGRAPDGDGPLYRNAAALSGLLAGWLGLAIFYRAAQRESARGPALLAALGLGFGTFLYWYLAFAPSMAHAPAFAASALVLALTAAQPAARRAGHATRHAVLLGAACGLAALLRWADVLVVLWPLCAALPRLRRRSEWPALAREAAAGAAAAALVFLPQMLAWRALYGSLLTLPQGSAFVSGPPAYAGVLFSPRQGLFSWSPLLYLGLLGLVFGLRRAPALAGGGLLLLAALTRLNAGTADWWGGAAFGARRFDAALPALGLGLAWTLAWGARGLARRPWVGVSALLAAVVGWNLAVAANYRSGAWDYAAPVTFEQMGHAAVSRLDRLMGSPFSLPAALWERVRRGLPLADYEALFADRPHTRFALRMGLDERLFLEDGWSEPRHSRGVVCRRVTGLSAGVVVPLHRPRPYLLALRVAGMGSEGRPLNVRVSINQRVVGSFTAAADWEERVLAVPAEVWRPGRNFLRLRPLDAPGEDEGAWLELAGLSLAPAEPGAGPSAEAGPAPAAGE